MHILGIGNRNQDQVSVLLSEPKLCLPKLNLPPFSFQLRYWPERIKNIKMTIKTYHYHSIFWWGWQGLASGRFTFGHTIESSIVTCNLRNITFQFVIVITFNGNVFSMHYGVPIASVVYNQNQSSISESVSKQKLFFFRNRFF